MTILGFWLDNADYSLFVKAAKLVCFPMYVHYLCAEYIRVDIVMVSLAVWCIKLSGANVTAGVLWQVHIDVFCQRSGCQIGIWGDFLRVFGVCTRGFFPYCYLITRCWHRSMNGSTSGEAMKFAKFRLKVAALTTAATVAVSTFAFTSLPGFEAPAEAANGYQPISAPSTTVSGSCKKTSINAYVAGNEGLGGDKDWVAAEARAKSADTIQIMLKGKAWKTYKYFNLPKGLEIPNSMMFIVAEDSQANKNNDAALSVTLDEAARYYAVGPDAGSYQSINSKIFAAVRPWGTSSEAHYDNKKDYIYHNASDAGYLNVNYPGAADIKKDVEAEPLRMTSWWRSGGDNEYAFAIYFEAKVTNPGVFHAFYISMAQKGGWGGSTPGASIKIQWDPTLSPSARVYGYYDSPVLDPDLFGVPSDGMLPKGLKLIGHFERNGELIKDMGWQKDPNTCVRYPTGYIDFSADTLPEIWKNLGQNAGRNTGYLMAMDQVSPLSLISIRIPV